MLRVMIRGETSTHLPCKCPSAAPFSSPARAVPGGATLAGQATCLLATRGLVSPAFSSLLSMAERREELRKPLQLLTALPLPASPVKI